MRVFAITFLFLSVALIGLIGCETETPIVHEHEHEHEHEQYEDIIAAKQLFASIIKSVGSGRGSNWVGETVTIRAKVLSIVEIDRHVVELRIGTGTLEPFVNWYIKIEQPLKVVQSDFTIDQYYTFKVKIRSARSYVIISERAF